MCVDQKTWIEFEMLQGNINRMCVTNDAEELKEMMGYAEERLKEIYNLRLKEIESFKKNLIQKVK
jgi:hypothetical protein